MIEKYSFGQITINGKTYNYDVEVHSWDEKVLNWQRKESHLFQKEDIEKALQENPEIIIFGTGEIGVAQVDESLKNFLQEKRIIFFEEKTPKAIEIFNQYLSQKNKKVIGFFHLTC